MKRSRSRLFPGRANQRFHVIQVALEGAPAGGSEAVLGLGQPAVKHFDAVDISRFLELAGMDGEISVRGPQQRFQFVEGQPGVHRQGADNSQAHALVD